MSLRYFALFAVLFLLFRPPTFAQTKESDPAALALFDQALEKVQARAVPLRKWQYRQSLTTRELDENGKIIARGTWKSIFRPGEKDPIEYVAEDLDGKLTFFHKDPEKSEKSSSKTAPTPDPGDVNDDSQSNNRVESLADAVKKYSLRDRYLWTCLPDEKAAGEDAAVIAFTPRKDMPAKTREQRFFSRLSGKIWISREDFTVLKSEGTLVEPYQLFWIIARITKLNFHYEVEPNPASRLLRKSSADAETVVSFPFKTVHQTHALEVEKFELRTPRK